MIQSNAAVRLDFKDGQVPWTASDFSSARAPSPHDQALYSSAFATALEAIGAAAFLLTPSGVVIQANAAGCALLSQEGPALANTLRAGVRGSSSMFALTAIPSRGFPDHHLAILRKNDPDPAQRISAAARRWQLTQRQREVLVLLARGLTNKTIAATLDRAEVTIELHVSALLAKSECQTRAELLCMLLAT